MFNQFHDILAGCSIKPAYTDAYNAFGYASETALQVGTFGAERISWRVNTTKFLEYRPSIKRDRLWIREGEGCPMVVFNPHSFPVKAKVCFGIGWVSGVLDSDDNEVPFQLIRAPYTDGDHFLQCMFEVELEPYGYGTYFIFKEEQNYQPKPVENEFTVTENSIENSKVKIVINKHTGAIDSYFDKETGKELAASPIAKGVVEDDFHTDTWAHSTFDFNKDIGQFSDAKLDIVETGYLRATIKVTTTYNKSTLTQYFSLWRGSKDIEVRCKLNFNEHYKIAKLSFPMNIENPDAVYSMPFGFIRKPADGLEEPAQGWIAVCEKDTNDGIALINDSKYSFCVKGNEMRMVMARGSAYLDHYGQRSRDNEMDFLDQGEQEFEYILKPCENDFTDVVKASEVLNMPLKLYQETHHKGELPPVYSGLKVSADNVLIQAMKYSEDGKSIVLRTFECAGKETEAEIDLKILDVKFAFSWKPQEIKTISIDLETKEVKEITGLPDYYFAPDKMEAYKDANLLKGGIVYSDRVTTVSSTYAEEIKVPFYGERLDGLMNARSNCLSGIVNGIDYDEYNPETDIWLTAKYNVENFRKEKVKNKLALQEELGLEKDPKIMMIGVVSRLNMKDPANRPLIIVMSGIDNPNFEREITKCGVDYFFLKPVDPQLMAERIVQIFQFLTETENTGKTLTEIAHYLEAPKSSILPMP